MRALSLLMPNSITLTWANAERPRQILGWRVPLAEPALARTRGKTSIGAEEANMNAASVSTHARGSMSIVPEATRPHGTRTPGRTRSGARPRQNPDWCRKGRHECCARTPSLSTHNMDSMSMAPAARPRGRTSLGARPRQSLALCVPEAEPHLARARGRTSNWRAPKAKPRWARA